MFEKGAINHINIRPLVETASRPAYLALIKPSECFTEISVAKE